MRSHVFPRICMALLLALLTAGCGPGLRCLAEEEIPEVLRQYEERLSRIEPVMNAIAKKKSHPCIYVTTLDRQKVLSKEEYVPAVVNVFNCPEEMRLTAVGGIRVRGNSTANDYEKPYRIKFDKKQNLLGLHGGKAYKSWVLLRSSWNLVPDYMGFELARAIFEGKYYSSDCAFVNLYMNGTFAGVYLLCEQNQAAKGRISVSEPEEGETGTRVGYLLEMDNYASDEHPYFTLAEKEEVRDIAGLSRKIPARNYSIKSDTWSKAQEEFIHRYLDGVFTILYEASVHDRPFMLDEENQAVPADGVYGTALEAVDAVMDLESLANMVILEELVQNYDVGAGSFFLAVDFTENSIYPELTFLAPWDFNWGYTEDPKAGYYASTFQKLWTDGWDRSNSWYILAMRLEGFRMIVMDKWRRLSAGGVLEAAADRVTEEAESLEGDLENTSWKLGPARDIGAYVKARIQWLNGQWKQQSVMIRFK